MLILLAVVFEPAGPNRWIVALLAFLFVTIVPIALLFVLKATGHLNDVEMRNQSEREIVYLACAGSYMLGTVLLFAVRASWPVLGLVALHVPYALVLALINRRWKVSIHAMGLASVFAAALVLFGMPALPLVVVLVFGAWARWAARAHTFGELVGGATIGFVLTGGGLRLLQILMTG